MTCVYLERNPPVKHKLMQEIEQVVPTEADITIDNLNKLQYLQCIIHEVGRIYGPVPSLLSREVVQ